MQSWPPAPEEYYLEGNTNRPAFQGDVFGDVPFVKAAFGGATNREPTMNVERRAVAVLGYPCDLYQPDGRPVKVQVVAPVVEATKVGIPADWAGAMTYVPLPNLYGDGVMHAIALQASSNVDGRYLRRDCRIAGLSEYGWAVLRQRLTLQSSRAMLRIDELSAGGAALWREVEMWTRWNESGRDEAEFQRWLDEGDRALGGFTRRQGLERKFFGVVQESLSQALA